VVRSGRVAQVRRDESRITVDSDDMNRLILLGERARLSDEHSSPFSYCSGRPRRCGGGLLSSEVWLLVTLQWLAR